LTRKKEPLEAYPTDALKLVGMMQLSGIDWAIIRAPDKTVHRVTEGNYLGRNYGEIIRVKGNRIQVQELVRNPVGKWEKRPIKLVMK
jgi:type IV pilus assembly protein PilP